MIATTYFMDQTSTIHSVDTGFIYAVVIIQAIQNTVF